MRADDRLTSDDAARLHMGSAQSPMTITVVVLLEGELPFDAVVRRVEERLLTEPRLRAHVEDRALGAPRWTPHAHLDVRDHVHRASLRRPADPHALEELASELASAPLDLRKPLWELQVIEGAAQGTALVLRVHHAIADGLALVRLLGRLADADITTPRPPERSAPPSLLARVAPALGIARLALSGPDPDTALRGPISGHKELAWSEGVPLAPIRDAAHRAGVGLSTMLLACTSAALRRALERDGPVDPRTRLRALVPVSVRGRRDDALGNRYVSVVVPLPVGARSHDARVAALRAHAGALSRPAVVDLGRRVISLLGKGAAALEHQAVDRLTRKTTLVVSSVPGPEAPLTIGGRRVRGVIGFAPVTGRISLGITLLGCGGELRAGVVRGSPDGPRAREIADLLEQELRGPWRPSPGGAG